MLKLVSSDLHQLSCRRSLRYLVALCYIHMCATACQDASPVTGFMMMPWPPVMAPRRAGSVALFSTTFFACPLAILASSGTSAAVSVLANRVALPAFDR